MFQLLCHPDSKPGPVRSINVQIGRSGKGYRFWYFLVGEIDQLVVPARATKSERRDDLWMTTCFEAFAKGGDERYSEFNFSPSGHWAAYDFESYRGRRHEAPSVVSLYSERLDNLLCVEARLNADFSLSTRLGLSAVVEESDGTKSYWSLAHPDGPPDFHHDACFTVRLADIA